MSRHIDPTRSWLRQANLVQASLLAVLLAGAAGCSANHEASTTIVLTTVDTHLSTSGDATSGTTAGGSGATGSGGSTTSTGSTGGSLTSVGSGVSATTFVSDVGWETDLGDTKPAGCKGKIDFLFVISGFYHFGGAQAQMIAAFPEFIATIESKFADFDYHIMVVEADEIWGAEECDELCAQPACMGGEPCCPSFLGKEPGELCSCAEKYGYPCELLDQVTACDATLGAGTVFPAGRLASNKPCKIAGGRRYMTKEQPDLLETFSCAALVGTWDSSRVADALVAALEPEINAPGGCNEGFLRDDALLMMTLVTRTIDNSKNLIYPWDWYDAVVAAKNGDPDSVIAFVIGNAECPFPDDYSCQLAKMFKHHIIEEIEAPDYAPAFDKATDLVEEACADFIPQ